MADSLRRGYNDARKLIESARILSPTFDDGVLYFTGAQVEIMRNLMAYANQRETFVNEYQPGYYLMPDDDDWDDIRAIVADLEDTLMGNPNTLWGYKDTLREEKIKVGCLPGTNDLNTPDVPEGEVWRLTSITVFNTTTVNYNIVVYVRLSTKTHYLKSIASNPIQQPANIQCDIVLKEDDYVGATFYGCTSGDDLYLLTAGYKMDVP